MNKKENLVWIDLEMTGLDPQKDVIVEIATIITDGALNVLHKSSSLVIYHNDDILNYMDTWVREQHTKSGLVEEIRRSSLTVEQAEEQTLQIIKQYCEERKGILCGNSVWQDAIFMRRYMPKITNYLNYRIVDVTSIKELVIRWYPNNTNTFFAKRDMHRALIDIEESIEELKHYQKNFFINSTDLE